MKYFCNLFTIKRLYFYRLTGFSALAVGVLSDTDPLSLRLGLINPLQPYVVGAPWGDAGIEAGGVGDVIE